MKKSVVDFVLKEPEIDEDERFLDEVTMRDEIVSNPNFLYISLLLSVAHICQYATNVCVACIMSFIIGPQIMSKSAKSFINTLGKSSRFKSPKILFDKSF